MSMSTRLEDLPDSEFDYELQQNKSVQPTEIPSILKSTDLNKTNIKANIKKRVRFEDEEKRGIMDVVQNEINEENALLLVILFVSSYPELTQLIAKIPFLNKWTSNMLVLMVVKAVVLLLAFLVIKIYVLPSLKV